MLASLALPGLGKEVFLSLYGQARTVMAEMEKLFQVSVQWASFTLKCHLSINCCPLCAESMFYGSSAYWAHWAGCGAHATIVFRYVSCFSSAVLLLSKPAWFCGWVILLPWVIITTGVAHIYFYLQSSSVVNYLITYLVYSVPIIFWV